ncbi:hypothetical protein ACKKBF_B03500 [Auxenochlorella protothecoides x Auxenochlorella symbiontica]
MASMDTLLCGGVVCNNLPSLCCGDKEPLLEPLEVDGSRFSHASVLWQRTASRLSTKADEAAKGNQIVLLLESLRKGEVLAFQITVLVTTLLLQAYIIALLVLKFTRHQTLAVLQQQHRWFKAQLILYAVTMLATLYVGIRLAARLRLIRKQPQKVWSRRQKILVIDAVVLLCTQFMQQVWAMVPLVIGLVRKCSWFSKDVSAFAFLREMALITVLAWMCSMVHGMTRWKGKGAFDIGAKPKLVVDLPIRAQLRLHIPLIVYTAVVMAMTLVRLIYRETSVLADIPTGQCPTGKFSCSVSTAEKTAIILETIGLLGYSGIYLYYLWRATRDHRRLPYAQFRLTFLYLRMHARHGTFIMGFMLITIAIVQLIEIDSCWTYIALQFGSVPTQVAFTMLVVIFAILLKPRKRDLGHTLEDWSHEVAWTEEERDEVLADRARQLASSTEFEESEFLPLPGLPTLHMPEVTGQLLSLVAVDEAEQHVPRVAMLCFETMVKLFYFCRLAYRVGTDVPISVEHGLSLFPGMVGQEVVEEVLTDTRAFLAWGPGTLVVSFRGTATRKNIITDIKIWKVAHQPRRRNKLGRTLLVHLGFYRAWRHNGFSERLLARVSELAGPGGEAEGPDGPPRVLFTGHSLGGALAVLAAGDLARAAPALAPRLSVYTFGAPRVGNGPFVQEFLTLVPDCWAMVNDQDPVPRIPKGWFHNAGNPVLLNPRGDLIIRPSEFDVISINTSGGVAAHHMLGAYALSTYAVMKEQFGEDKGLPGGDAGVVTLASHFDVMETLTLSVVENKVQDSSASAAVLTTPPSQAKVRRGGKKGGAVATMEVPKVEADALERQVDAKEGSAAGSGSLTDVELGLELQPSTSPQPGP